MTSKKNNIKIISLLFGVLVLSCQKSPLKDVANYVNPFIGTGGHGHTFPGATLPFGMVQLSPDTRLEGWDGCGGYHYSDSIIFGFSHTHLSGTGVSDYGDVLFMPTVGEVIFDNGYKYASKFSHNNESATAGYYSVWLSDYNIKAELTTSLRVGFHKYTFPKNENSNIILDLEHRDELTHYNIKIINDSTIEGMRISNAWAKEQHIYFYAKFSRPFIGFDTLQKNGKATKAAFKFKTEKDDVIMLKVAISAVDTEGARKNLEAEIQHWNFEKVKQNAHNEWNNILEKIKIETPSEEQKEIFYTALYHSYICPNLYHDVDGRYRGMDLKIHQDKTYTNYTVFSLWDTFRATHPLFTIMQRERTLDFIKTFLNHYKTGGNLPVWELSANETGCMIGYHSVSVIADAYAKGIKNFDEKLALEAMKNSADAEHLGLSDYKKNGFISAENEPESVSKTLEYAYNDWCIAQFSKQIGSIDNYKYFIRRAQNYKNIFDPENGFMRAKINNRWFEPFDPSEVNYNYTEANAWQYSMFVPQDISGLIALHGGAENFEKKLDQLFSANSKLKGTQQADITGLIGQYAHGNEPSHHMAYLYNYIGKTWKTQERTQQILKTLYSKNPDGLSGNEDCGQMSSWYVLSSIGFYPVTPGSNLYTLTSPLFETSELQLENGKSFKIICKNLSKKNIYIQSIKLDGVPYKKAFITHHDIMDGGEMIIEMGNSPNKNCFTEFPLSNINDHIITPVPYLIAKSKTFKDSLKIEIKNINQNAKNYYTVDGKSASEKSMLYEKPFYIKENTKVNAISVENGILSHPIQSEFFKIDDKQKIKLLSTYANQYAAGGNNALIDHQRGGKNYRTGSWQGYQGQDLEVIVDFQEIKPITTIDIGFLQDINSWIFYPKKVDYFISDDGTNFKPIQSVKNSFPDTKYGSFVQNFRINFNPTKTRYIKIKAENYGICPPWHLGNGGKTWLFADEIIIN